MNPCFPTVAAAVCLCLPVAGAFAAAPPALRVDVPGPAAPTAAAPTAAAIPATSAPAAAKPTAAPAAAAPTGDAAAKHAKRTACLKDAKAKKLVGAEKTAFLRNCIAPP